MQKRFERPKRRKKSGSVKRGSFMGKAGLTKPRERKFLRRCQKAIYVPRGGNVSRRGDRNPSSARDPKYTAPPKKNRNGGKKFKKEQKREGQTDGGTGKTAKSVKA